MTLTVLEYALGNALLSLPLAILAWSIGRTRRNPSVAHFAWLLVMIRLVMPPIASVPWLSIQVPLSGAIQSDPTASRAAASSPLEPGATERVMGSVDASVDPNERVAQASADLSAEPPLAGTIVVDGWTALGCVWFAGTALVIAVSVVRIMRFQRMLRAACLPADPRVRRLAERAAADLGMRLRAEILVIPASTVPFVWSCFGRPRIVLPASIVSEMSDEDLLLVLTHELAHVRRLDHIVRWLDWAVVAWLWWNPLAWIARRGLRRAEELACDALVLRAQRADARDYGRCLVSVAESIMTPAFRAPVQACTMGDGGSLEERIRLIMSGTLRTRPSAALRTFTLATAGASMLFGVAVASPSEPVASSQAAVAAPVTASGAAQDVAPAPAPAPIRDESTSGGRSSSSTRGSSSTSSSISFKKDGKLVSIEENGSGITVTVDGKSVQARNIDDLKQQHPDAYQLYVEKPGFAVGSAGGSASGSGSQSSSSTKGSRLGSSEGGSSASDLLREKLKELQRERPDDPRLQGLIQRMLEEAAAAAPGAAPDAAPAPSTAESKSGRGAKSSTRGSSSTSSSISFKKDGKSISIQESRSGITVTVDGKSVRARNIDELKQEHPDAYKLYVEKPGFAVGSAGGSARASGSQSSSSTKGSQPGGVETKGSSSRDRSVTVIDNGKEITIAESASGITVTVGEKTIRARNAEELKKESAEAFQLYERHLNKPGTRREGTDAEDLLRGNLEEGTSASEQLRNKLKELQAETSDDPMLQELIKRMLQEMNK